MTNRNRPVVAITTPLEPEHVDRIATAFPARIEIRYRPDLMSPIRFPGDHGNEAWKRTSAQEREWRHLLRDATITWDFAALGDDGPLDLSPGLRWVQTTSAGVGERVKAFGLDRSGVLITTASGFHARPLAEFVMASLLYHVKRFPMLQEEQRAHRWERYCTESLAGKTLALIGPGRIGREVARLATAFGMTVWALGRDENPDRAADLGVERVVPRSELHTMLAASDVLVLATPHTPETEGMIGAAELAALRPGAAFINIARGVIVDEPALIDALRSGHVGFAALDVTAVEPLPTDSPLWDIPNVLISPHSASTVAEENSLLTERFITNLRHYLNGELDQLSPLLDKTLLY